MRVALALVALALAGGPLRAADIPAATRIDAVVVFPQGAEVRRIARVRVPAGDHTLIIPDLPAQAVPASIRVEGKASGRLELGSVDSRRLSVPRGDAEAVASARRRIEAEIEKLRDERAQIVAEQQAAEAQRTFLTNLLQLPTRPAPPAGAGAAGEDWGKVLGLVAKELAPVNKQILEAGVRVREVDRRIRDAEGRLRAEAPVMEERTEVKVAVAAAQPVEAEITVRYQVMQASWSPFYDARLSSGSKTAPPKLTITRRSSIVQRTSEPWDGVALSLSTTRPAAGTAAPELRPITVDYPPDRPPPVAVAPAPMPRAAMRRESVEERAAPAGAAAPAAPEPLADAVAQQAQVEAAAYQAVYSILGRQTVMNTGEVKRVQIDEGDFDATLTVRSAPRVDERAYLYAKLTVPRATPWLAGQVALFRDATFVGNGHMPQLAPGQEHEIGFGADDRVRVRAANLDEKRAETGMIATTRTDTRSFRLVIRNLHERPIAFVLHDQLPVSNNQEIKVDLIAKPMPTRRDVEDRRGVLAWEDRLNPDEERTIEFGYRVSWPAAKSIVYGR